VNQTSKAKTTDAQMYDPGYLNMRTDVGIIGWDAFLSPCTQRAKGFESSLLLRLRFSRRNFRPLQELFGLEEIADESHCCPRTAGHRDCAPTLGGSPCGSRVYRSGY